MAEEATGMEVLLKKMEEMNARMRAEIEANTAKMSAELREEMKALKRAEEIEKLRIEQKALRAKIARDVLAQCEDVCTRLDVERSIGGLRWELDWQNAELEDLEAALVDIKARDRKTETALEYCKRYVTTAKWGDAGKRQKGLEQELVRLYAVLEDLSAAQAERTARVARMKRVEDEIAELKKVQGEKANERAQVEVARKEAAAARDSLAAKEAARCAASDSQAREEETAKMAKERAQAEAVRNEAAAAGDSLAAKEATRSAASDSQAREDDGTKMAIERAKNVVARDETEGARYSQTGSQDAWRAASDSQAVNEEYVMEEGRETVGEATSGDETTDETWGQMTPPHWSASGEEAFHPEESSISRSKASSMVTDGDGSSWGAERGDTEDGARTHPFDRGKVDSWIAVSKSFCSPQARVVLSYLILTDVIF